MKSLAEAGHLYQPEEELETMCAAFCKHYCESLGFPGEALCYCGHPENKGVHCGNYSVFDGVAITSA